MIAQNVIAHTPNSLAPTAPTLPLSSPAYHGLAGEFVKLIEPHSEADPAALLIQTLAALGNCVGRTAYCMADGSRHYPNLFAVLVGTTSKSRKGTAWRHVHNFFSEIDSSWSAGCIVSGLSSAEGLLWSVRDPVEGAGGADDKGVVDKRRLCVEEEFATVLKVMERQGNTLSSLLRTLWDGRERSQTLTRHAPIQATGVHVSVLGHITTEELRRSLTATEQANGLGNRFIWILVSRSKTLPLGGGVIDEFEMNALRQEFSKAIQMARQRQRVTLDAAGQQLWCQIYGPLSEGRPGLTGCMLGRAEAQVLRLALLYALLELSPSIAVAHLQAALSLWKHAEKSVTFIFGQATGNRHADRILAALEASPAGLRRSSIHQDLFQKNQPADDVEAALQLLLKHKLAHCKTIKAGKGRPAEHWFAGSGD
jgi:Protein of unknown function (DUF3987)